MQIHTLAHRSLRRAGCLPAPVRRPATIVDLAGAVAMLFIFMVAAILA